MSENGDKLQCKILSSSTGATLETLVNEWLDTQCKGSDITIKFVTMSEGDVSDTINIVIFYTSDYSLGV